MKTIAYALFLIIMLTSCTKKSVSENSNDPSLFMSFSTPDWQRTIPCELLVFEPNQINDSTSDAFSTSQSTRQIFHLSYPLDSSEMVRPGNLKRYPIMNYSENNAPFQFSQKLPMDANSLDDPTRRLGSLEGLNDSSYNEIQSIQYMSSDNQTAKFLVKGSYAMRAQQIASNPLVVKPVTGSYALEVKTTRN